MEYHDPDMGCKNGEKNCAICGTRGEANMNGNKKNAPLQFVKNGKHGVRWYCKQHQSDKGGCQSFDERVENPYLLSGEELDRTEQRAKAGTLK